MNGMTNQQFKTVLKMLAELVSKAKTIEEAVDIINRYADSVK